MAGLTEGRQALAWIGAPGGDHVLLEPSFAGALVFPVCALGIAAIGGFESRWTHCGRVGLGRGSLGEVSLRTFCWEILSSVLKGLESARKRLRVVIQKDVAKLQRGFSWPQLARLPLGIGGCAANLGVKVGLL